MTVGTINPNATLIPDQAEVWLVLASDVDDINTMIPETVDDDLVDLGWLFTGLIDDKKGIPLTPSIEIREYDAFGHPRFRVKLKKGKIDTGFTTLETNAVTKQVVLPGSTSKKIGRPKDVQIFVLYKYVDEDGSGTTIWVTLTKAPVELKAHGGVVDGELSWAEMTVHHTADAAGDVFDIIDASSDDVTKTFTIPGGVTAYTVSAGGSGPSSSIVPKTKAALQAALRTLASVQALPSPGVTVDGPDGGPLVAVFTGPITPVTAAGTGGTVVVS